MVRTFGSTHFGEIHVEQDAVIEFPAGIPGFEDLRSFTILRHPEHPSLIFLQSLESAGLCFLAMPAEALRPDYVVSIRDEDLALLGADAGTHLQPFAVLSLVEGQPPTANLLSPIVIHPEARRAVQAIRPDNLYTCTEALVCS